MAQLELILGDKVRSRESLEQAKRRGYTKSLSDRLVQSAQSRFAFVEGRGANLGAGDEDVTVLPPGTLLLSIPELVPPDFRCGIEILNDSSTPMDFVVEILQAQLKLSYAEAITGMLDIHKRAGRLFPIANSAGGIRRGSSKVAFASHAQAGADKYSSKWVSYFSYQFAFGCLDKVARVEGMSGYFDDGTTYIDRYYPNPWQAVPLAPRTNWTTPMEFVCAQKPK